VLAIPMACPINYLIHVFRPYAPGKLTATCVNGTKPVPGRAMSSLSTESAPVKLDLVSDRAEIEQSPNDLVGIISLFLFGCCFFVSFFF